MKLLIILVILVLFICKTVEFFIPGETYPQLPNPYAGSALNNVLNPKIVNEINTFEKPYLDYLTRIKKAAKTDAFIKTFNTELENFAKANSLTKGVGWQYQYQRFLNELLGVIMSVHTRLNHTKLIPWYKKLITFNYNIKDNPKENLDNNTAIKNNVVLMRIYSILRLALLANDENTMSLLTKKLNTWLRLSLDENNIFLGDIDRGNRALPYTYSSLIWYSLIINMLEDYYKNNKQMLTILDEMKINFNKAAQVYNLDIVNNGQMYQKKTGFKQDASNKSLILFPIAEPPSPVKIQTCKGLCQNELLNNNTCKAIVQDDGNFVLYDNNRPLWASNTNNKGAGPFKLWMKDDENLVLYDKNTKPLWASNTNNKGAGPYELILQDDCNLVAYSKTGPIWASNTNKK